MFYYNPHTKTQTLQQYIIIIIMLIINKLFIYRLASEGLAILFRYAFIVKLAKDYKA
jgi:hypothetical protein